jgi:hypothetical protein
MSAVSRIAPHGKISPLGGHHRGKILPADVRRETPIIENVRPEC